jgi:glycosyltransferase involved in cell wall biosynthesis
MKTCILIPYYNHGGAIARVIASLQSSQLPCFIVDDGSSAEAKEALARAVAPHRDWITSLALPVNQGKGGAVMMGCDTALAAGFTHALQVDADGQHNALDIPKLLQASQLKPDALISGRPIYDASVPRGRLYGRYITHIWVWINTLSLQIKDSMCGLRVYPLNSTCAVWKNTRIGKRMDFDIEVMVRMAWAGVTVVSVPTNVTYPVDGVSHFAVLRDNLLISGMHARLFFGMLIRSPLLLGRRLVRLFTG